MARTTINRRTYSVNTPSNNDVKQNYFNHFNWKGINQNNNFLAVDQETFEDAKNIYVDENNVLKSRPSIKREDITTTGGDITHIEDVHYFTNGVTVYKISSDELLIEKDNNIITVTIFDGDYRLLEVKDFILLFDNSSIRKIDSNGFITDADIYIPKTKVVSLDGSETDLESKNIFTDEEMTVYLYNPEGSSVKSTLIGKQVKLTIDDETFEFVFDNNIQMRLFYDVMLFKKDNLLHFRIPDGLSRIPFWYLPLSVSSNDTVVYFDTITNGVYYSADKKIFRQICTISADKLFGETNVDDVQIKFCRENPAIVFISLNDGLYAISVASDLPDGSYRYPELTRIRGYTINTPFNFGRPFDVIDYDDYVYIDYDYAEGNGVLWLIGPDGELTTIDEPPNLGRKLRECYGISITNMFKVERDYTGTWFSMIVTKSGESETDDNVKVFIGLAGSKGVDGYSEASLPLRHFNFVRKDNHLYAFSELSDDNNVTYIRDYDIHTITNYSQIASLNPKFIFDNNIWSHDSYSVLNSQEYYGLINVSSDELNYFSNRYLRNFQNFSGIPYIMKFKGDDLYLASTKFTDTLELEFVNEGSKKFFVPSNISELTNLYLSHENNLYISEYREDDEKYQLYFPEINKQSFKSNITNLHPLSETEMGIFLPDEIHYAYLTENGYAYRKSRLDFGCPLGNEIETSYDGKYTLFDCERGFAALSYQDFVATTEQSVAFLSDIIPTLYKDFKRGSNKGIKLMKYENYLFLYSDKDNVLLFDFRNNSWWRWEIIAIDKFVKVHEELKVLKSNALHILDMTTEDYVDYDGINESKIDWFITSQKLHFGAINYYKHITNLTFAAIENSDEYNNPLTLRLQVRNYRDYANDGKEEEFEYNVQIIKTFVKRLNYAKVREFQYTLSADLKNAIMLPLALSGITVKYKIGGQIR